MHPVSSALLAGLFTWSLTAVGATAVFFFREIKNGLTGKFFGFAAGVMLAASFWSLLEPSIALSAPLGRWAFVPALTGFSLGSLFLAGMGRLLEKWEHAPDPDAPNVKLVVLAITLHNIPEGLAVGVAFGAADDPAARWGAVILAIGIGIQNIPEGAAVSMPLRSIDGFSRLRCFHAGQLSAVVEPIFAVLGALLVTVVRPLLPFALGFAAGAMIFITFKELVPAAAKQKGIFAALLGFALMMSLDAALG